VKVLRMDEYIKEKVSETRYVKLRGASRESDELRKLIEGSYVCANPKLHLVEENDGLDFPSILSIGDTATQAEVTSLRRHAENRLFIAYYVSC
jgi:hypothetical protein